MHQLQLQWRTQVSPSFGIASKTGNGERNRPLWVGATHGEATKPSEASAEGTEDRTAQALVKIASHVSGERQCVFAPWQHLK